MAKECERNISGIEGDELLDEVINTNAQKEEPLALLWLMGLPGCIALICAGISEYCRYSLYMDIAFIGNQGIGMILIATGLIMAWPIILLARFDFKTRMTIRTSLYILVSMALTIIPLMLTMLLYFIIPNKTNAWPIVWPFPATWLGASVSIFLIGFSKLPKVLEKNGRFALIVGIMLLVVFLSIATYEGIHESREKSENERRVAYFNDETNLMLIDSAVMAYYSVNGVYPDSIEELIPDYLKEIPDTPPWVTYSLEISDQAPRAVSSTGRTY